MISLLICLTRAKKARTPEQRGCRVIDAKLSQADGLAEI
jgi:hypothetical protein